MPPPPSAKRKWHSTEGNSKQQESPTELHPFLIHHMTPERGGNALWHKLSDARIPELIWTKNGRTYQSEKKQLIIALHWDEHLCLFSVFIDGCMVRMSEFGGMRMNQPTNQPTTILQSLYRSTRVSQHLQLSTGGFCWCKSFTARMPLLMATTAFG